MGRHIMSWKSAVPLLIAVACLAAAVWWPVPKHQTTASQPRLFKLAGTVRSVDAEEHKLVVQHGDIPGFMSAMTMPYDVRKEEDLTKVSPGDQIAADVVATDSEAHLENVKVTSHAKEKQK